MVLMVVMSGDDLNGEGGSRIVVMEIVMMLVEMTWL